MRSRVKRAILLIAVLGLAACAPRPADAPGWVLVVHGGAGSGAESRSPEVNERYRSGLRAALDRGSAILERGGSSLDAVEQVIRLLEDDPTFNAGRGAVFNHDGEHELDASLMDGSTLACGAVAGVTTVKNPISLARLVMERTRHVLLAGEGAERFATETGVERVDPAYFFTEQRHELWQRVLEAESRRSAGEQGTVGAVALDLQGNLAAGTSTGGLTGKRKGRVGDSPIVGAGTYAKNSTCAVSGTGVGEEFIRHGVAVRISDLVEYRGLSLRSAASEVVEGILESGTGGVIALDGAGEVAVVFTTEGMAWAVADAAGRREVGLGR
jgi:beta-aspartyl-peptidase (threonine type)